MFATPLEAVWSTESYWICTVCPGSSLSKHRILTLPLLWKRTPTFLSAIPPSPAARFLTVLQQLKKPPTQLFSLISPHPRSFWQYLAVKEATNSTLLSICFFTSPHPSLLTVPPVWKRTPTLPSASSSPLHTISEQPENIWTMPWKVCFRPCPTQTRLYNLRKS